MFFWDLSRMPKWRSKRRRALKSRKTRSRAHQLRVYHKKVAGMFASSIDFFSVFLRPVELAAVMSVCRETSGRHWETLLEYYMRFFYKQDLARLFGVGWLSEWDLPIRGKLQALLKRQCLCGHRTDFFDPNTRRRMCVGCAYYFAKRGIKSLTTALFYDDQVYLEVNVWSVTAFDDIAKVPLGKRVKVVGRLSTAYDILMINAPIWIDGIDFRRSAIPAVQVVINAAVRMTDVSVIGSVGHPDRPVVWAPHTLTQDSVYIADCLIRSFEGQEAIGNDKLRHLQLHRNVYEQAESF
jgi:hypothetical protein